MSKKRPLTTLEWFLIGLIRFAGITTGYQLRNNAGLSWGGIRPSLARLERWGFVERSPSGKRRKKAFRLTTKGEQELKANWEQALDPVADLETVIRAAWLAHMQCPSRALEFVYQAIRNREAALEINTKARPANQSTALGQFDVMRMFIAQRRSQTEAKILRELLTRLREQYNGDTADR